MACVAAAEGWNKRRLPWFSESLRPLKAARGATGHRRQGKYMPVSKIFFGQRSCDWCFSNGRPIWRTVQDIVNDVETVTRLPSVRVGLCGRTYVAVDNRRIVAVKIAGQILKREFFVPVIIVTSEQLYSSRNFDTETGGTSILVRGTGIAVTSWGNVIGAGAQRRHCEGMALRLHRYAAAQPGLSVIYY